MPCSSARWITIFLLLAAYVAGFIVSIQKPRTALTIPDSPVGFKHLVNYFIDTKYTPEEHDNIKLAISSISLLTCIYFEEVEYGGYGLPILNYGHCSSCHPVENGDSFFDDFEPVFIPSNTTCILSPGNIQRGVLRHLGLQPTHLRPDREHYLEMNDKGTEANCYKNTFIPSQFWNETFENHTGNSPIPYDYGSVMHDTGRPYGLELSSDRSVATFLPIDRRYKRTIGNKRSMSFVDAHYLNLIFSLDNCTHNDPPCLNGGYKNPRDCSICICPTGFTGATCSDRATGCGRRIYSDGSVQIEEIKIGRIDKNLTFISEDCVYWVQVPKRYTLQIRIELIRNVGLREQTIEERMSCSLQGMEIKIDEDPRVSGVLLCDPTDYPFYAISAQNPTPIILHNRMGLQEYRVSIKPIKKRPRQGKYIPEKESSWFSF